MKWPHLAVVPLLVVGCGHHPVPVAAHGSRRVGDAMLEVGMRFEQAGHAMLADRWDFAGYEMEELQEIFEDDVLTSKWMKNPEVARLAHQFTTRSIPALRAVVQGHDRPRSVAAVADAARACNDCHRAAGMAFIKISESLGASVPMIATEPQ